MLLGMRCPTCGTENAPDSRFCGGCGARLEPPRVAPTFKITDDAAYPAPQQAIPTPPPGSLNQIGHLPTPTPGSLAMPPQPRLGSIPPTNPAPAIARPSSAAPTDRLPSKPPDMQQPASRPPAARVPTPVPAPEPSMSMPVAPKKSSALIAVVLIADLGLAAAGGALLFRGLQKPKAAVKPAQKTEAPAPASAAAADLTAPSPAAVPAIIAPPAKVEKTVPAPKEAAKKAPVVTKPAAKSGKLDGPVDPYGGAAAPDLRAEVDRMADQSVGSFHNCLAQAVQTQPIHGEVRIAFVIEPDGHVDHARVAQDTTESPQLSTCLAATIATWTFAPHPGPAASFERPFNYP
jgi:TonB family protein